MKRFFLILVVVFFYCNFGFAQGQFGQNVITPQKVEKPKVYEDQKMDFGLGIGLDYGGFVGANICYSPYRYIGLFASAGFYIIGFGWQTGVKGYLIPRTTKHVFRPFGKLMFGTNRGIIIQNSSQYNKIYTGFTAGAGFEFRFGRTRKNGMNIELNFPINSAAFTRDYNNLKHTPGVTLGTYLPIAFSFGYHFVIL